MTDRTVKLLLILNLLFLAGILLRPSMHTVAAQSSQPLPKENEELERLTREDQSDRTPPAGHPIDWKTVEPRDRARLERVKELYSHGQLQTGRDYYNAALILQHGDLPEDYLLAHELCVVAISQGARVESLAAASEDRFLMNIGRPQRFGTQYRSDGGGPYRLYTMDSGVTDQLRRIMNVPSRAEAKAREAEMNGKR
ncbi:MAG TPA: hypothetical protein VJH03_00330 [Blastocatellia bacterium]|nr:hypothetical protein [Blastocatellia bacterium]